MHTLSRTFTSLVAVGALTVGLAAPVAASPDRPAVRSGGRVDTTTPTFSHPTTITNPLFPITTTKQMVSLGAEGAVALRQETTPLDQTRVIRVNGQDVKTIVSEFVAYGDGEIIEVAIDYFAQADDGSVWYFGEDVTNYDQGQVENHNGTWLAGRDGPPGMIMPAHPKVGDVYRPENIPGLVFEETTVKATDLTLDGPTGPVTHAIRVEEHPANAAVETKTYAPGYGEFEATVPASDEYVKTAIASPTDSVDSREPRALDALSDAARGLIRRAPSKSWSRLRSLVAAAKGSWDELAATELPPRLADQMSGAIDGLDAAVAQRNRSDLAQAAIDVQFAALDLELQYREVDEVDRDRIKNFGKQLLVHQSTGNVAGAASDAVIIDAITRRL